MMRGSLFVFRVLLPPLFLFRLCLPRPPELDKEKNTGAGDVQFAAINSGAKGDERVTGKELLFDFGETKSKHFEAIWRQHRPVHDQNLILYLTKTQEFDKTRINSDSYLGSSAQTSVSSQHMPNVQNSVTSPAYYQNNWFLKKLFRPRHRIKNRVSQLQQEHRRQFQDQLSPHRVVKTDQDKTHFDQSWTFFNESELVTTAHDVDRRISTPNSHTTALSSKMTAVFKHRSKRTVNSSVAFGSLKMRPPLTKSPDYMVHLFHLLSGTHYDMLRNTVVTSFANINQEDANLTASTELKRTHTLAFNFFTSQGTEIVQHSELRMYMVLNHLKRNTTDSNDTLNEIFSGENDMQWNVSISEIVEISGDSYDNVVIVSKMLRSINQVWESFNVTSAVQGWVTSGIKILEVKISRTGETEKGNSPEKDSIEAATESVSDFQMDINTDEDNDPLLIVFSKKTDAQEFVSPKREKREVKNSGEIDGTSLNVGSSDSHTEKFHNNSNLTYFKSHYFQGLIDTVTSMKYHSLEQFKTNSLQPVVNLFPTASSSLERIDEVISTLTANIHNFTFQNIEPALSLNLSEAPLKDRIFIDQKNQSSLSANPYKGLQNMDKHTVSSNFSADSKLSELSQPFPTLKPSNQTDSASSNLGDTTNDDENFQMNEDFLRLRIRRNTKSRYKRHLDSLFKGLTQMTGTRTKRSKRKRNSCRRAEMYVNFEKIKWDKVILFPRGYQAFECTGKCYSPISEYLTPSKHAIIQTLVHTSYPKQASRACCVPTKLEPISILYYDDNGNIKYDYTYEGMVVAECGCR